MSSEGSPREPRTEVFRLENFHHHQSCPNLEIRDMELETPFPVVGDLLAEISLSMGCHLDKILEGDVVDSEESLSGDQPSEWSDVYDRELSLINEGKQSYSEESVSGAQSIESTSDYSHQLNSIMQGQKSNSEEWGSDQMHADVAIECDYPVEQAMVPEDVSYAAYTMSSPVEDRGADETQQPVGTRQKYMCFASIVSVFILIIAIGAIVYTLTKVLNLGFLMF